MIVEILLTVAQVVVFLYDVVTYPIYHALAKLEAKKKAKSDTSTPNAHLVRESSESISWKRDKSRENDVYREYIIDNKVIEPVLLQNLDLFSYYSVNLCFLSLPKSDN